MGPRGTARARMGGMRRLLVLAVALLLVPAASARPSANRPVAHRRGRDRERGSRRLARPARRPRPQAGSPRRPADGRGAAAWSRRRPEPARDRDAARLALAAAAQGLPRLQRSAGGEDRPRRPLRLRRGRRQRGDLRDRPRQAEDRRIASTSACRRTTCRSARTAAGSGSRSARSRRRSSGSTRPNLRRPARRRPAPPALPCAQRRLRARRSYGLGQLGAGAVRDGLQRPTPGKVLRRSSELRAPRRRSPSPARGRSLTSGYGSSIEAVLWRTYRRLGHRPDAVRLVQPRHVRRPGRDLVALHRPDRGARGRHAAAVLDGEGRARDPLRRDLALAALADRRSRTVARRGTVRSVESPATRSRPRRTRTSFGVIARRSRAPGTSPAMMPSGAEEVDHRRVRGRAPRRRVGR